MRLISATAPVLFACLGSLSAQAVSIKLTTQALGLGNNALNTGSTVNADIPGKLVTSATPGVGTVLTVQRSGIAGPGTPADPLLATITARSHLDVVTNLPPNHDHWAGALTLTEESNTLPDGADEGAGVKSFTVDGTTGKRVLSGGLAKIEGSKEVSGGTSDTVYDPKDANGAPHVDEEVVFTFNPNLAVLAWRTSAIVSKFESSDKLDIRVTMASGKQLQMLFQGTENLTLFEAISASKGVWRVNVKGIPGVTEYDLLSTMSIRAIEDNPGHGSGTAEHFLVTGATSWVTTDCTPGWTLLGSPRIGHTVNVVLSGRPGCDVCAILSFEPGPIVIGPLVIHAGFPFLHIISGNLPPGGKVSVPVPIPNNASLVGKKVYLAGVSLGGTTLTATEPFSFTILP